MNQPLQCSGKRFGLRAIDRFSAGGAGKQIGKLRGQVAGFAQPQQAADGQLLPLQIAPALEAFGEIVFGDAAQRFQAAFEFAQVIQRVGKINLREAVFRLPMRHAGKAAQRDFEPFAPLVARQRGERIGGVPKQLVVALRLPV